MIKYFKYIFAAAIVMMAAVACQDDIEDSFSKNPTAPVLTNNGSILMTENTMSEDIVWAWKAARFIPGETQYSLFAEYQGSQKIQIGSPTTDLSISMSKANFQKALSGFTGIPENSSFNLNFTVVATDGVVSTTSNKEMMTVYSYGNAVSAVIIPDVSEIVLDITDPLAEISLISWSEARLTYGEAVTYSAFVSYNGGEQIEVASGLTDGTFYKTVDEWNEAAISAGAPEGSAADIQFVVMAYCESIPEGIPSEPATINITTYLATFPTVMYLPGNYQGWNPATAATIVQSTSTKGYYEAFIDLTTEDGGDTMFKFCPDPTWDNAIGGVDIEVTTDGDGNTVVSGMVSSAGGDIAVPSGMYRIALNKKFNKLTMFKVTSMGLIGSATVGGWGEETPMTYNAADRTFSVITTLTGGEEYKFRLNNNWTSSMGDGNVFDNGANAMFTKETGEYNVIVDVTCHPYNVKFLSTSYPVQLYLPGSHQGWSPATAPTLQGNGEGLFEGGVNLVDAGGGAICEFKFCPVPAWQNDFGGIIEWTDDYHAEGIYGVSSNIAVPSGYYYVKVDMAQETLQLTKIEKVGLIGSFNGWGGDEEFTYDSSSNLWTLTVSLAATDEFKVRMNADWGMNRGFAGPAAVGVPYPAYNDGANITLAADGTYTISLNMSSNPNTITFTK